MRQVTLGRTGLLVSQLGLGTANVGYEVDEERAFALFDTFAEAGGTLLDTADGYGAGESERVLGRWLAKRADAGRMVACTKVGGRTADGPNDAGLSRRHVLEQIEVSLRRLGRDHIDVLYAHVSDPLTRSEETLRVFDDLVRSGKVRYVGVSNLTGWQITYQQLTARMQGWEPLSCLQSEYSLLSRQVEWEVLPAASAMDLGVLAWAPLGGGWLTGKHTRSGPAADSRVGESVHDWQPDSWDNRGSESTWRCVEKVREIATEQGRSMAQVALNWLRAKPVVTAPIVGARTVEQLADNLACTEWELSPEQLDELDAVSRPTPPYQYHLIEHFNADRTDALG